MHRMLIDGIGGISIHGGLLRIDCVTMGPDGKPQPSGQLLVPGPNMAQVLQALVNGAQELDKKMREQMPPPTGSQPPVN